MSRQPSLTWTAIPAATSYTVEVASDPGFATIVSSGTVTGTSFQATGLAPSTTYYWRVRATNACGAGTNSVARSFTTAAEVCFTGSVAIPDNNTTGVTNVLSGSSGLLTDLNVRLEATHTWVGDLRMTLTHGATTVALVDRPGNPASTNGCSANDVAGTVFDFSCREAFAGVKRLPENSPLPN